MKAVFAIPGDRHRRTGGFIYESTLLDTLRDLGHEIAHLELPDAFPDPRPEDVAETRRMLCQVPPDIPILLDGFIPGFTGPETMAAIPAPTIPIIHHPLGLETGLAPDRAADLLDSERTALAHAAHVIVPSPHTAQILMDDFDVPGDRLTIGTPGFAPISATRTPIAPPLILAVGSLVARKGHDVLLDALARIVDLDWQARIVGGPATGATADALRGRARDLGLADRVTFTGPLDDAAVARSFAEATIFALASRYEGYGIVFGEAMQHGLPIVACHAGAVPDTVGAAGDLVPVDEPSAFADVLRRFLTDAEHYDLIAATSARMGRALPTWSDTARIVVEAVAAVSR
ncbi:MAG: glycosyltransferase family 4 protein [Pseudomonadota bacterium]